MGKQVGMAAAALLLAVAGCKSSSSPFSVNLTIVADSSLSDAVVQRIGDLSVDVSGAEISHREMLVSLPFQSSRQERVTYRSGATKGQLLFDVTALASDGSAIGFGEALANITGSSTDVTLTMTDQIPAGGDMAGAGDMGPPPPTLTSTQIKAGAYDLFGNQTSPDGTMVGIVTRDSKLTPTILDYMGNVQVTLDDGAQPAPADSSNHKPGFFPGNNVIFTLAANANGAAPLKLWYPGAASIITLSMISYPIVGVQTNGDGSYLAFEDNPMNNGQKTDLKYGPRNGPLETVVSQNSYWYMLFRFTKTGIFYSPVDSVPAGKVDILRIAPGASATTAVRVCLSCARSYVISDDGTQIAGITGVTTFPDGSGKLSVIATSNNGADAMTTAASANTINPWMQLVPGTSLMEATGPPTTADSTGQTSNIIEINLSTSAVKIRQQDAVQPYIIAASAHWVMFSELMAVMNYGSQFTALQPIVGSTMSTTVAKGSVQIDASDPSGAFTVAQSVPVGNTSLPAFNVVSATGTSVALTAPGSFHSTFVDATHILYMQGDELRAMDLGTGVPAILDYGVGDYAYHAGTKRLFYVKRGNKAAASDGLYLATY